MEIGLVVTPLNNHLAAGEVAHVLADSDARVFVAHEAIGEVAQAAAAEAGIGPPALLRRRARSTASPPYASLMSAPDEPRRVGWPAR